MTCKRCGNVIAGNEQFCTRCGLPVAAQPKKSGKKANIKLIVGISSGAAVLIIALIVTFVLLGRVSADKYISELNNELKTLKEKYYKNELFEKKEQ